MYREHPQRQRKSFIITQFSEAESHEKLTAKTLHKTLHSFIETTFSVFQLSSSYWPQPVIFYHRFLCLSPPKSVVYMLS